MTRSGFILVLCLLLLGCSSTREQIRTKKVYTEGEGKQVRITPRVAENLFFLYQPLPREIPYCLHGIKTDSSVVITWLSVPDIEASEADKTTIRTESGNGHKYVNRVCESRGDHLGFVHNHPSSESCVPSSIDMTVFRNSKSTVFMIACFKREDIVFYALSE